MGDGFMFFAEDFIVRHGALGFVVFAGEHGHVGFEGVALRFQAHIFALEGPDRFGYTFYFCFKLFGFAHAMMILLDRWPAQEGSQRVANALPFMIQIIAT